MAQFVLVHQMEEGNERGQDGQFEFEVLRPLIVNFDLVREISPPHQKHARGRDAYVQLYLIGGSDSYPIAIRETFEEVQAKLRSANILIE
jgi:hypothetical protein